ncbi:MAG: hypothetical protein NC238_02995 [Dehalobacter sp.]|nr:hypothetical protein [Dehalobacter sp.]
MRLRQRDLGTYYLKRRLPVQDPDGTSYETYEEIPNQIQASIQPAGGKLMAEMYGERLAYMKTMRYEGNVTIHEGDGICIAVLETEDPDYKVVGLQPWDVKVYTLEKVR